MNRYVRWGNILFLVALLANFVMPPGWVHRAVADPPADPLAGNFITGTMVEAHENLFGTAPEGQHTGFYPMTTVIKGVGSYIGVNNLGEPFVLNVIRHYQYTEDRFSRDLSQQELDAIEACGCQRGLFWGTLTTPTGSINIIGASMSWAPDPQNPGLPTQGFVPLINHDALMSYYIPDDPNTGEDDVTFEMMAEDWDPNGGDPGPCMACLPPGQGVWCPDQDPEVIEARRELALCIAEAAVNLALALAGAVAGLALATKMCLATVEPLHMLTCLSLTLTGALVVYAIALAQFAAAVAFCMIDYMYKYNAAKDAACDPS